MTEDEMVGWNHQLNGHEFEQTPGDNEGQGSLVCFSSRGPKESDMTEATWHTRYHHIRDREIDIPPKVTQPVKVRVSIHTVHLDEK